MLFFAFWLELKLVYPVFPDFFFVVHLHQHFHCLAQHVDAVYFPFQAVVSGYVVPGIGKAAV